MAEPRDRLFLLGPQPAYASLIRLLERVEVRAPAAYTTAGWETEEGEDQELREAIGGPCRNLELFARSEHLFAEDTELIGLLRERQDVLRHLRDVYNARLGHLLDAARELLLPGPAGISLEGERASAVDMIRRLDSEYLQRVTGLIEDYDSRLRLSERPLLAAHRKDLAEILSRSGALLIAGGHVAILLNRLRLFGVLQHVGDVPVIAWSGGAMALAERLVFYHDFPPQGKGNPEVLRAGMGLCGSIQPLPEGDSRLALEDPIRVQLFARRFEPFQCVLFDEGTVLERRAGRWHSCGPGPARQLGVDGQVREFAS